MPRNFDLIVSLALVFSGVQTVCAERGSDIKPRLTIATSSGQSVFRIGERIPVVLSFTGPDNKSFAIDLATYDRSGRLYEDIFNVEPKSGWEDPLAAYFRYGSYMMGGLRGGTTLSSAAVTVNADLNEWVRFDQSGTYTLTVTSHRVGPVDKRNPTFPHGEIDLFSSNSVTLTIVPATHAWQDETLSRIVHDLPKTGNRNPMSEELPAFQKTAISDLRFLGSTAAVHLLAARLRDDVSNHWDSYFGLLGLSHEEREHALLSMRSLLNQPDFPVSRMFLDAMSWLHMPEDQDSRSEGHVDARAAELYQQKKTEERDFEWQDLVLGLHEKTGPALRATETTLLDTEPAHPDPYLASVLGSIARASFASMSPADQTEALEQHWDLIGSRELLVQLRDIAKGPLAATDETNGFFSPQVRSATALRRWFELEPENAAAEAIHQIGQAYPKLYASQVNYLTDESFPQFESLWAETLAEGDDINDYEPAASLLLRFGTGAVSPKMVDILHHPKDHLGNRSQPAMSYLIKFDPSAAEAVLQRDPNRLVGFLDSTAKDIGPSDLLTKAALSQLKQPDTTADALIYLRHYGDEHVRDSIYQAFLTWYERNKHLAESDLSDLPEDVETQFRLGAEFVSALLCNQGWIPDEKLKSDVLQRILGPEMKRQAEIETNSNADVTVLEGDYASYEIGAFDSPSLKLFEQKLDQYPAGTTFKLQHVSSGGQHSQDQLEASLPALFLKHGMKLITSAQLEEANH